MFCRKCGKKIADEASFCPYCGNLIKKNGVGGPSPWLIVLILVFVWMVIIGGILLYRHHRNHPSDEDAEYAANESANPSPSSEENTKDNELLPENPEETGGRVDAESYFRNRAAVLEKIPVRDSKSVESEEEILTNLGKRGFREEPVVYGYAMDGSFLGEVSITHPGAEKHPIYQTFYLTEDGRYWSISTINGAIVALPLFYNFLESTEVPVIISETEYVMTYDSVTNTFYKLIPKSNVRNVITVPLIDAETLEGLTIGKITEQLQ